MKIETKRYFEHSNGFSVSQFIIRANAVDKKITEFTIDFTKPPTPMLLHLLAKDLSNVATVIENELTGKKQ